MRKLKTFLLLFFIIHSLLVAGETVSASTKVITYINKITDVPAIAVEILGNTEKAEESLSNVHTKAFDFEGNLLQLSVKWNFSAVNFSVPGTYNLYGTVQIPEGYTVAKEVKVPTVQTTLSVQRKGAPEINAYYESESEEFFVFPWLPYAYPEQMKVWLRKAGDNWENLTGTGFAACGSEGLQLSKRALVVGSTYSMMVQYDNQMTKTLRFVYGLDKQLNIISYQNEFVGNAVNPTKCISSYDEAAMRFADRYYAEALPVGADINAFVEKLNKKAVLSVSVLETFEDTEEVPAIQLNPQWNLTSVNTNVPGLYTLKGKYKLPEGYSIKKDLKLPEITVYVSVQEEKTPRIDTCYFINEKILGFPVLFQGLTREEFRSVRVYLKKFGGESVDITENGVSIESTGIYLDAGKYIQNNSSYEIRAEYKDGYIESYSFTNKDFSILNEKISGQEESELEGDEEMDEEEDDMEGEDSEDEDPEGEDPDEEDDDSEDDTDDSEEGMGGFGGYYSEYSGTGYSTNDSGNSSDTDIAAKITSTIVSVTESTTDTATVLSGKSLNTMMEESGNEVAFEKMGITVKIPESTVKSWQIQENEAFKISVQPISDKGFSVRVFVRDEEIKEIPGTKVQLSVSDFIGVSDGESVKVTDIHNDISSSTYDNTKGILEINLKKTGDYFMEDPHRKTEDDYLDDEYESNENIADEEIPVDEEFWEDESLFAEDEFEEDVYDDEFAEEDFEDELLMEDEYVEDEDMFEDEGLLEENLTDEDFEEGFTEEDFEETDQNSIEQFLSRIKEVIDGMKEKGTLIPAAVSIGAALILLVLSLGKKNK